MRAEKITKRLGRVSKNQIIFIVIAFITWFLLLTLHGLLPHMAPAPSTYISSIGSIECGGRQPLELLHAKCTLMGGAAGASIPQSLPFYIPAVLILEVLRLNPAIVFSITGSLVMALALLGAYKLFRLATKSKYIALLGGFVYLISPLVFSMRNFGGTYWGFLLIPFFIFSAWKLINVEFNFKKLNYKRLLGTIVLWCIWAASLLFLDGYSFVMCAVSVYILLGSLFLLNKGKRLRYLLQACLVFVGLLFAYALYSKLLPTGSFGKSQISLFRALGLDVVTIFIPTNGTWLASLFHVGASWSKLWGDGSNTNNYIGVFLFLAFLYGIYYSFRKTKFSGVKLAIILISLVGFIFALGPSLKADSKIPANSSLTQRYNMPSNVAPTDPPVYLADRYAPGFSTMRATYRWFALTEIGIIFFALIGLESLNTRKCRPVLALAVVLIALDLMPSPHSTISDNIDRYEQNMQFNHEVINPLKKLVTQNQQILIYPNTAGDNDYLANYMAPMLDIKTYNVGDDKAVNNARKYWPGPILDLLLHPNLATSGKVRLIRMAFDQHEISMLIIPKFDLRWDSYVWPPSQTYPDRQVLAQALNGTGKFTIKNYHRFLTVVPKQSN